MSFSEAFFGKPGPSELCQARGCLPKWGRNGGDMGRAVMIHHLASTPNERQNAVSKEQK